MCLSEDDPSVMEEVNDDWQSDKGPEGWDDVSTLQLENSKFGDCIRQYEQKLYISTFVFMAIIFFVWENFEIGHKFFKHFEFLNTKIKHFFFLVNTIIWTS